MGTLQWAEEAKASRRNEEREEKQVFSTQPKQLFARLKQNEQFSFNREQQGRSSKEERKVNALALRADEGRDNLR